MMEKPFCTTLHAAFYNLDGLPYKNIYLKLH